MSEQAVSLKPSNTGLVVGGFLISFTVLAIAGFILYSSICPCERTPGGFLFGERVEAPVSDWAIANEQPLCQIQIWSGIRPHSINLNCMAASDGKLYLSCSDCESKYWANVVGEQAGGKLRLGMNVYPVSFERVEDPQELDRAWLARAMKLQSLANVSNPASTVATMRPEGWWSFNVTSTTY
ncbi:MAG: hypothetical protein ACSHXZ_03215 [Gammaproteobacteria bacterium]